MPSERLDIDQRTRLESSAGPADRDLRRAAVDLHRARGIAAISDAGAAAHRRDHRRAFRRSQRTSLARTSLAKAVSRFFMPPPLCARTARKFRPAGARACLRSHHRRLAAGSGAARAGRTEIARRFRCRDPAFRGPDGKLIDPESSTGRFIRSSTSPRHAIASCSVSMPARFRTGSRRSASAGIARSHAHQAAAPRTIAGSECAVALRADLRCEGRFLGVMGFGFQVDEFFKAALATAKARLARPSTSIRTTSSSRCSAMRPEGPTASGVRPCSSARWISAAAT